MLFCIPLVHFATVASILLLVLSIKFLEICRVYVIVKASWPHFYQTRSAWSMDQGSNKNHSPVNNCAPTVTKFCVMWEGQALPHDTKFGNCRGNIVDSRVFLSWSLIHGWSWSGLIKLGPGSYFSIKMMSYQGKNSNCKSRVCVLFFMTRNPILVRSCIEMALRNHFKTNIQSWQYRYSLYKHKDETVSWLIKKMFLRSYAGSDL